MTYSLDTTGLSLQNKIIGEQIVIPTRTTGQLNNVFLATGPYYWESLQLLHTSTGGVKKVLAPLQDYKPAYQFLDATAKTNQLVAGGIELADVTLQGTLTAVYQNVGGTYEINAAQLLALKTKDQANPAFTTYEMICGLASITLASFPVVEHPWSLTDNPNLQRMLADLERLGLVIHMRPSFLPQPGQTVFMPTKGEIGLGKVENYPPATLDQAIAGTEQHAYMTPSVTQAAVSDLVQNKLTALGYMSPVAYAAGLTPTNDKFLVSYQDNIYSPRASALPFTTTGDFALDKNKFGLVISGDRDHWHTLSYTITGNEPIDAATGARIIDIGVTFVAEVRTKMVINRMVEPIEGIDYNLDNNKLYLRYPHAAGDKFTFHYKRNMSKMSNDRPYYRSIKILDGTRTFSLTGLEYFQPEDMRIMINEFMILTFNEDYQLSGTSLTLGYPLQLGDVVEVVNLDNVPVFGYHQTRSVLTTAQ